MIKKLGWKKIALICSGFVVILGVIGAVGNSGNTPQVQVQSRPNNQKQEVASNSADAVPANPQPSPSYVSNKAGDASLYPNPALTPGDVFAVDAPTICVSGYSSSVRDVPLSEKKQVYAEYGVSYPQATGAYEVDHFIPLELGGSNDIKNLWLEPANPTPGFHQKDQYENYGHKQVCNGEITLAEAQRRMATDWYKYWLQETGATATPQIQQSATATTTASAPTSTSTNEPAVKKSSTGICHAQGTTYYDRTTNYTPYDSIDACLASGGRLPK